MTGCYVTGLPRQFMRGVADFDPQYPNAYCIARDAVEPSAALQQRIWPWLAEWTRRHELVWSEADSSSGPRLQRLLQGAIEGMVQVDHAAPAFLELLRKLRIVIL